MNRPGEAIVHYQRAAELQTQTPIEALLSMGDMATCKILTRGYSLSFDPRSDPPCYVLTLCLVWLFFLRGLRWCFVSVYRHAAVVPGERTAVARHQHTSWWEQKWIKKWLLTLKLQTGKNLKCVFISLFICWLEIWCFFSHSIWYSLEKVHFWTLWQNVRFPEFYCWCCLR